MKRIVFWVVAVVLFVALYEIEHGRRTVFTQWARSWTSSAAMAVLFFLVLFLLLFPFFLWRSKRAQSLLIAGTDQLSQGRYLEALRTFEEAARRVPRSPIPVYNQGVALLGLWRVDEAEACFARASRMSKRLTDIGSFLAPTRAFTAAFLGRSSEAEARLAECAKLKVDSNAMATLSRAVLAARAARWAAADALLGRSEMRMLGGPTRGLADALRAWASHHVSGEQRHVDRVAIFEERESDAFATLWPELHEFIHRAPAA